jgi:pimeloyl-ACP methyl ester carboxylesterase
MHKGYADTEVGQIHFREAGDGELVVLLHQTASSSIMYHRVLPFLAEHFHVVAVDTPGFGMSDPPPAAPGPEGHLPHYARAVVGLLEAFDVERACLVGARTGASIALEVAATRPERVRKLVLAGTLFLQTEEDKREWEAFAVPKEWEPDGRGAFLHEHVLDWVAYFARENDGEQFLLELTAALQAGPRYWWAYRSVVAHDAYALLPRVEAPILFVNPLEDSQFDLTRRAHLATPGSRYVEIPGPPKDEPGWVGFASQYPREFAEAVAAFLEES